MSLPTLYTESNELVGTSGIRWNGIYLPLLYIQNLTNPLSTKAFGCIKLLRMGHLDLITSVLP